MSEQQRGFAGFESLVSDLSDLPAPPSPPTPEPKVVPKKADADDGPDWTPPPEQKKKWSLKWLVAVLVLGGVLVVAVVNSNKRSSYMPSHPPATTTFPATSTVPAAPQYPPPKPEDKTEEKPPVGEGLVLSAPQLRYCLAQGARIDGADKVVNTTSKVDVSRFNGLVDDYNARCSKTQYRVNMLQTVKAEVEARRTQLEREGAALIRSPRSR